MSMNKMVKWLFPALPAFVGLVLVMMMVAMISFPTAVMAESKMYSVAVSTRVLGQAGNATRDVVGVSGIVRAKRIVVDQTTTNAMWLYAYKDWTSTTAANEIFRAYIPATVGSYDILGPISSALGNFDILNMPNCAFRQSDSDVSHVLWLRMEYGDK